MVVNITIVFKTFLLLMFNVYVYELLVTLYTI